MNHSTRFLQTISTILTRAGRLRTAFGLMLLALALGLSSPMAHAQIYTLHTFPGLNTNGPVGGVINVNGTLYGTTLSGGTGNNGYGYGSIFSINSDGTGFQSLHNFGTNGDGANPSGSLLNVNGTLYGTTRAGGAKGLGTVFSINPDGTGYKTLYSFLGSSSSDGSMPTASLIDVGGVLYGTTYYGGSLAPTKYPNGYGTIFSINPDGTNEKVLYNFMGTSSDGYSPHAELLDVNGVLYGTTGGNKGSIFSINPDGTGFQTVYNFTSVNGGAYSAQSGLINVNGIFYGTTDGGGTKSVGTIFSFDPTTKTEAIVYSFNPTFVLLNSYTGGYSDGERPEASLINVGGVLYGTTSQGGLYGDGSDGILFSFDLATQTEKVIVNLDPSVGNGIEPSSNLININGTLYGTTVESESSNGYGGTVFRLALTPTDPVAHDDAYISPYGSGTSSGAPGVLINDDPSGSGPMTATLVTNVTHGTLTLRSDGSFGYRQTAGYSGTDSFTYQVTTPFGTSNIATVTLTIPPVVPIAGNNNYYTRYNTPFTLPAPGVLGNDDDGGSSPMTATLISNVTHGTLTLNSDGSFIYTPNSGFMGYDTFTYQAVNPIGHSKTATVILTVQRPIPIAHNDFCSVRYNTTRTNPAPGVLFNDDNGGDGPLTATLVSNVSHGTLSLSSNGAFTYTPNLGYVGIDTFTYRVSNSLFQGNIATVTLTVQAAAPVAHDDSCAIPYNTTRTNPAPGVLGNDFDGGSRPMTATLVTNVSHGTLTLGSDGSFTYTPNSGYVGTDSFTYQVSTPFAQGNTATVTLTVLPAGKPTAHDDACTVRYNTTRTNAAPGVLGNDDDGGSSPMTAILVSNVAHGTLTLNSDGSFSYTPTTGYVGTDSFTYQAVTPAGTSNIATVTLTIPATTPIAYNDGATILHDTARFFPAPGVLANDDDGGAGPIAATLIQTTQHGYLSLGANGSFFYLPLPGFTGTDTFTYQVSNALGKGNIATVTLTVQ